jgi:hypothetical protein
VISPRGGPDLAGEEVRPRDRAPVGAQERPPGRRAVRRGRDPVVFQDLGDGTPGTPWPKFFSAPLDARVAPPRILRGHSQKAFDRLEMSAVVRADLELVT